MPMVLVFDIFEEILSKTEITLIYGLSKTEIPNEIQDIDDYYEVSNISEFEEMIARAAEIKYKKDEETSFTEKVKTMIQLVIESYDACMEEYGSPID